MQKQLFVIAAGMAILSIASAANAQQREKPIFETPRGWHAVESGPLATARFLIDNAQTPVLTVTRLPEDKSRESANINRWLAQVGLKPVSDAEALKLLQPIKIGALAGSLVDLTGPDASARRLLAAYTNRGGETWYFRLLGPAEIVSEQKAAFESFLKSVRFEPVTDPASAPATPLYDGKPLTTWLKELKAEKFDQRHKASETLSRICRDHDSAIATLRDMVLDSEGRQNQEVIALLRQLGSRAVPTLIQGIWDENPLTRAVSIAQIGAIGWDARAASPSLVHALKDPNPQMRGLACRALENVTAYAAIPQLASLLEDPEASVRIEAAKSLILLDAESGPVMRALLKELSHLNDDIALAAAELLARLGPEGAASAETIAALLEKSPASRQRALVDALGAIGTAAKPAAAVLKQVMRDNPDTRTSAAIALWQITRDKEAIAILQNELTTASDSNALTAATALWQINQDTAAIDALIRLTKKKQTASRAIQVLAAIGPVAKAAVPALLEQLNEAAPNVRIDAALALGRVGADARTALPALENASRAEDATLRVAAITAICRIDPEPGVMKVMGNLAQAQMDDSLRTFTLREMQRLGKKGLPLLPVLKALLTDSDESIREAAAVALWRINRAPEALTTLTALLRSARSDVRGQAARSIGYEFGAEGKAALPALIKLLWDPSTSVRVATAEELARIGPAASEALPALTVVLGEDAFEGNLSAASEALGRMGKDARNAVPALQRLLTHPNKLVQVHAAHALLLIASDSAGIKKLEEGMNHRNYQVRITAAEGLWQARKDPRVVPFLLLALRNANLLEDSTKNNEPYMLIRALGRVGPDARDAVSELQRFLNHYDSALAETAAEAIRLMQPPTEKKR